MSLDRWVDELGAQLRHAESRRAAPPRIAPRAAALVAVAAAAAVLVLAIPRSDEQEIPAQAPTPAALAQVPADTVVRRTYMGVSCPQPNVIECDRVGLAVWMRDAVQAVEAEIGGRRFALTTISGAARRARACGGCSPGSSSRQG